MVLLLVPLESSSASRRSAGVRMLPDLALALAFLSTWLWPGTLGPAAVTTLSTTLLLEFFAIHGAAFLGVAAVAPFPWGVRTAIVSALCAVYLLILWPLAQVVGPAWIAWAFWALLLNRLLSLAEPAVSLDLRSSQPLQDEWAKVGVLFLGLAVITSVLPISGWTLLTPAALSSMVAGGEVWQAAPRHAMALGTCYFGIMAWRRARRA